MLGTRECFRYNLLLSTPLKFSLRVDKHVSSKVKKIFRVDIGIEINPH